MEKSAEAFRTISEVSEILETPAHVLRFWESRFSQVKPVKRAGGRRYYRPGDLALLAGIKQLLHEDGMTIRGVQKLLREKGVRHVAEISPVDVSAPPAKKPARRTESRPAARPAVPPTTPTGSTKDATAQPTGWPPSPDPDVTEAQGELLPDPEQTQADTVEAPMDVDVPTLPLGTADNVLPIGTPRAPEPEPRAPAAERRADLPASALLRAMDAHRAREKRVELTSVYERLNDLKERVVRGQGSTGR